MTLRIKPRCSRRNSVWSASVEHSCYDVDDRSTYTLSDNRDYLVNTKFDFLMDISSWPLNFCLHLPHFLHYIANTILNTLYIILVLYEHNDLEFNFLESCSSPISSPIPRWFTASLSDETQMSYTDYMIQTTTTNSNIFTLIIGLMINPNTKERCATVEWTNLMTSQLGTKTHAISYKKGTVDDKPGMYYKACPTRSEFNGELMAEWSYTIHQTPKPWG